MFEIAEHAGTVSRTINSYSASGIKTPLYIQINSISINFNIGDSGTYPTTHLLACKLSCLVAVNGSLSYSLSYYNGSSTATFSAINGSKIISDSNRKVNFNFYKNPMLSSYGRNISADISLDLSTPLMFFSL